MTRARPLPHAGVAVAVALLAAALLAGLFAVVPRAKASTGDAAVPILPQPFHADSANLAAGDTCPMGATDGTLLWHPGPLPAVDVRGTALDHPLPGDTSSACAEDGRYSTVTFAAYSGGARVASSVQRVDNGQQAFSFTLRAAQPIQLVTVQVCRSPLETMPFAYCGRARGFPAPPPPVIG